MRRTILAVSTLSLFALSGCAVSHLPTEQGATLKALAQAHHVCAVAVAVIRNRQLAAVDTAAGCQPEPALRPDSVFQAASLGKPVFAYAVLQLAAQGRLALDVPLVTYLPQGYRHQYSPVQAEPSELVTDPRLQAVTARMVLNHTSGLPNWASGPLRFDAEPGIKWGYSGEGYVLLQRAVEALTGLPLDQFMAVQVFEPLAMHHSSYAWHEGMAPLPGTKANGSLRPTRNVTTPVAAFSLYTTAEDYGKFFARLLADDSVLRQLTASPVTVEPGLGLSWGLGLGMEQDRQDTYVWQWGNNLGYRAFVIGSVSTGDGLVMLTNSENGLALAEPLTRQVLPGEHKVFQFSYLGGGMLNRLCNTLHVCL
ncbi:hypothetical protein GCM10027277_21660 [Pseudoduganella ginsengisoli]|nr:serine hydrolase domain-containing protein [Pseudoduganella ginsengisoli]